jgi:hypothetical protein
MIQIFGPEKPKVGIYKASDRHTRFYKEGDLKQLSTPSLPSPNHQIDGYLATPGLGGFVRLRVAAESRISGSRTPSGPTHCAPAWELAHIASGICSSQVRAVARLGLAYAVSLGLLNGLGNMAGFIP